MKLRTRFALLIGALTTGILLVAAALVFVYQDRYLTRKTNEYHAAGLDEFAKACAVSSKLKNQKEFLQFAFNVEYSTGVAYGAFYSPAGKTLFSSAPAALTGNPDPLFFKAALAGGGQSLFSGAEPGSGRALQLRARPVRAGKRTLGLAVMYSYPDILKARRGAALRNGMRRFVWAGLIAVAPILLLSFYLGAWLTRPIEALARGAREVAKGDLAHRIPVARDDEIGALAAEFNRMTEKLQELDRMKEDLMAGVTHELRSPTTSIAGFADMLLSGSAGPLTPKQEEWLETIKRSSKRLGGMINNILDMARLDAGLMQFSPEPVPPSGAVDEVLALFQPQAAKGGIGLSAKAPEDLPDVLADPDSLRQVLINLLGNALKFTPEGGKVTVEARAENGSVAFSVTDTGPGIASADAPKLFTKFFQLAEGKGKGTGLGLAICKGLLEAQGGSIRLFSEPGKGATFTFTLPQASKAA